MIREITLEKILKSCFKTNKQENYAKITFQVLRL